VQVVDVSPHYAFARYPGPTLGRRAEGLELGAPVMPGSCFSNSVAIHHETLGEPTVPTSRAVGRQDSTLFVLQPALRLS
jgi:hypothetical protein